MRRGRRVVDRSPMHNGRLALVVLEPKTLWQRLLGLPPSKAPYIRRPPEDGGYWQRAGAMRDRLGKPKAVTDTLARELDELAGYETVTRG